MFGLPTTDAPETEKPACLRPADHPSVKEIAAELRDVKSEIEALEEKRQNAQAERRRLENEQRRAREADDFEQLSRLTLEEEKLRGLNESERERLLDLHGQAMELKEERDAATEAAVPEIEGDVEAWAAPRLQEMADALAKVLHLSRETVPVLRTVHENNLRSRYAPEVATAVSPDVPMLTGEQFLGDKGHAQRLLRKLIQAGYEPRNTA